jgi:uncharacterized iron-regulated membrane protein
MTVLIKKIHTYLGLLTFINLMVYGIAGLAATFHADPENSAKPQPSVYELPFKVDPNLTDRQVAERAVAALHFTLVAPVSEYAIKHDRANRLWLDLYHSNGTHKVTFLETEGKMRIEEIRNDVWSYLDNLHTTTSAFASGDIRMRLWANYNEFAMWSLIGMTVSGVWLWLAVRPGHRWAQVSFATGMGIFVALWILTR